jgi:glycosyltransferase involved in cell wall biosynthesis
LNHKNIVGINTLFWLPGKVGGTEVFLMELLEVLNDGPLAGQVVVFTNNENQNYILNNYRKLKIVPTNIQASNKLIRVLYEQLIFPFLIWKNGIDLLHSPGYTCPIVTSCKKITTLFDLNYYFHPENFGGLERQVYKILIPLVVKFSDFLLTHTEKAKSEICEIFKCSPEKIFMVYPYPEMKLNRTKKENSVNQVMNKYHIKGPYILANATIHPHKNLPALIKAFYLGSDKEFQGYKLVLLGIGGRDMNNVLNLIKLYKLENRVKLTGWVEHEQVPAFFKNASAYVQPSLYEGFGMPLIEAMAENVPIVASIFSCIPEVVGKAGILVDTTKPENIKNAINQILTNKILRSKLISEEEKRIKVFSKSEYQKKLVSIYDSCFGQ